MKGGIPRRLMVVASLIVVQDLAFFAAISPLLPHYISDLGLSETEAGVLTAAYPAGTMLAALPAGFLAARAGPRVAVIGGLLLLGGSSVAFGFAQDIVVLDSARFLQGIAGALTWAGAFTWVIEADSGERRGTLIGTLMGFAIAGALLGPPLGAIAETVGTELIFGSVLVVSLVLAGISFRLPEPGTIAYDGVRDVLRALGRRPVLIAGALLAVPSIEFGAVGVLVPLRISELGAGALAIAAGFTVGAAAEGALSPLAGRLSDKGSWIKPYVLGLAISAVAVAAIGIAAGLKLVLLAVIGTSIGSGICFTPATKAVSDGAEASGLHQGMAAGVTNIAWAGGEVLGSVIGGSAADSYGLGAALLAIAAFLAIAALVVWRGQPGVASG
ncbi:MAG: MFS transporter [Solirubrobacterales bacterium]|nr:MFS transporter [Solirubrobacterales bacterium]